MKAEPRGYDNQDWEKQKRELGACLGSMYRYNALCGQKEEARYGHDCRGEGVTSATAGPDEYRGGREFPNWEFYDDLCKSRLHWKSSPSRPYLIRSSPFP